MSKSIFYLLLVSFLWSCSNNDVKPNVDPFQGLSTKERKSAMEGALKRSAQKEQTQIKDYLKRQQIKAVESKTGVHYFIYEKGEGSVIKENMRVEISYVLTNLKGDTIYSIPKISPESFLVEQSEKESGLHEVIKQMNSGDKAIVVIPSYRAHGISGDENKIPPLTTVVYNLKIHSVQ